MFQVCDGCFNKRIIPNIYNTLSSNLCRYQCTLRDSLASLSLLICPTPYPRKESLVALAVLSGSLQASFRVPGDLAREDDLCEEIALIELVSNN